jgi:hypothetical protein
MFKIAQGLLLTACLPGKPFVLPRADLQDLGRLSLGRRTWRWRVDVEAAEMWRWSGDGVEVEENYSSESFSCEEACTRTMLGNPDFFLGLSISRCHCHHCHENMARLADHDRVFKHRNAQLIKTSVFADSSVDRKATRNPIAAAKQTRRKRRNTAREINNLSDRVSRSTGHDLGFIPVRNLTDL